MLRNKFNPTMLAVVLIAELCFFLPDVKAQIIKENKMQDTTKMQFTSTGEVKIGVIVEKQIAISVDRYNELTRQSKWQLLNAYTKNDFYTTKWKNKKTGKEKEIIGSNPPSERLCVICGKEFSSNTHKCIKEMQGKK